MEYIQEKLFSFQDKSYRDFHSALIPNIDKERIIGVRVPILRKLAKQLFKEKESLCREFMKNPMHKYYEENNLHALFIEEIKDFDECIEELDIFLPWVDNWATCDIMAPKVLKKNKEKLLKHIKRWISSKEEYTVRFGVRLLMNYFLDDDFKDEYLKEVSLIKSDKYYIKMMIAWFYATALVKKYNETVLYLKNNCLDIWVHNKTIQKAIESNRISNEEKIYLRTLKRK